MDAIRARSPESRERLFGVCVMLTHSHSDGEFPIYSQGETRLAVSLSCFLCSGYLSFLYSKKK